MLKLYELEFIKKRYHDFDIYPIRQIDVTGTWNSKRDARTFKMYLTQIASTAFENYEYFDGKLEVNYMMMY